MVFQFLLYLGIFNVLNSQLDAYRILKDKSVSHFLNLSAYTAVFIFLFISHHCWTILTWWEILFLILAALSWRQLSFDIPLNLRRSKKWNHQSTALPPKAFMDRVELFIFRRKENHPEICYLLILLISSSVLLISL